MRTLDQAVAQRGVALMGICNVTPDSFSDGGRYLRENDALALVDKLLAEGADILDIGGESTRPGARAVPANEQIARILPVVRGAVARGACVSVDTTSPEVAAACLDAGAAIVNDVSCLADARLANVVAEAGAAFVLMHSRPEHFAVGSASDSGVGGSYENVVADVIAEWKAAAERAARAGIAVSERGALVMDPGLGFAKTARESDDVLARVDEIVAAVGVPVLIGASRKSFLKLVDPDAAATERLGASIGAALVAAEKGAQILRVHDVRATAQAIAVWRRAGVRANRIGPSPTGGERHA